MFHRFVSIAVCVFIAVSVAGAFALAQQAKPATKDKIQELLKERRDVLQDRAQLLEKMSADGAIMLEEVIEARREFYEAELQFVTDKEKRIEVHRNRLDDMTKLEEVAKLRFDSGTGPMEAVYSSKAERLKVEIEMLQEQKQ